jgi:hypothetical protein
MAERRKMFEIDRMGAEKSGHCANLGAESLWRNPQGAF